MNSSVVDLELVIDDDRTSRVRAIYSRHASELGRLAYLLSGDRQLSEDLVQEAFVRLIGRLDLIRDDAAIPAYLRRSVVNLLKKHWRKVGHERAYLRRQGPAQLAETALLPDLAARDELWGALGRIPWRQRAAIVLRYYEDLSEQQTARVLGCRVGTVKAAVSRGLRRMSKEMQGDDAIRA